MSEQDVESERLRQPATQVPYTKRHQIPTVQKYYKEQEERRQLEESDSSDNGLLDTVKQKLHLTSSDGSGGGQPYQAANRNMVVPSSGKSDSRRNDGTDEDNQGTKDGGPPQDDSGDDNGPKDTTEADIAAGDARKKRKAMKKRQPKGTRVVTDPVTHLPVTIHDFTNKELDSTPENLGAPGSHPTSDTSSSKAEEDINKEKEENLLGDQGTLKLFPPPSFDIVRDNLVKVTRDALFIGTAGVGALLLTGLSASWLVSNQLSQHHVWYLAHVPAMIIAVITTGSIALLVISLRSWLTKHVQQSWDDQVWQAARAAEVEEVEAPVPESTQWLNRLLASVWPLINPDLFTSMADMIEDVMQASLPRFVRMVAVEDFGQGSEAFRILGVRWLPTGAAAKSVDEDGNFKAEKQSRTNDREVEGEGEVEEQSKGSNDRQAGNAGDSNDDEGEGQAQDNEELAKGLEKEEGEFVNMEVAFAYRATSSDKRLSNRAKNAHLLIKFYLPGSIPVPIWVTLQGIVGVMRVRLQLTPDPPFIALATITLVGQPKADLQAIPLSKHMLNVMDLPFISGFVQSSIDAALAEYVAPRSLTLNLKEMLMGDDFKKDTVARGIIVINIKRAYDFKEADTGIPLIKDGSADPYITAGWAKFGKPVWSSRVILETMEPVWNEMAFLLVTPEELHADERIRLQLWDSDRTTADDDVGRIEVDVKELMRNKKSLNNFWNRTDGFMAMKADEKMPGKLEWSVGYFPKLRLTDKQIRQQKAMPKIKDRESLKEMNEKENERKMREASERDMSEEIDQNKEAGLIEKEIEMVASAPPPEGYPTGILSIQLHNITGLNLQILRKNRDDSVRDGAEGGEVSDDLPSAFATVIINGQKVFKTRTKPKNSKPFFNASTERVIKDWRNTDIMVSVRDARVHEDDALMGLVFLKLGDVFKKSAQVNNTYPLVGGVGYGRFRISLMFRACTLQLPRELRGWEFGTLEIGAAKSDDLPQDLQRMRIKIKGPINKGKLHSSEGNSWTSRKGEHLKLGTRNRYSSCITFEFRKTVSGPDKTAAFGIFWLRDISDSDAKVIEIPIFQGGRSKEFYRMRTHCTYESKQERLGTLKVDMKHWPGLSQYHRALGKRNRNMHDVLEVLDTAHDNLELGMEADSGSPGSKHMTAEEQSDDSGSDSSDANYEDSDHDDEDAASLKDSKPPQEYDEARTQSKSAQEEQDDGERGPLESIKDYRNHRKTLHRQQRGAMQWKAPRTAKWMKHKMESGKDKLIGLVSHHDREPDVETEV